MTLNVHLSGHSRFSSLNLWIHIIHIILLINQNFGGILSYNPLIMCPLPKDLYAAEVLWKNSEKGLQLYSTASSGIQLIHLIRWMIYKIEKKTRRLKHLEWWILDKPIDSMLSFNLYTNETHVRWGPFCATTTTSLCFTEKHLKLGLIEM